MSSFSFLPRNPRYERLSENRMPLESTRRGFRPQPRVIDRPHFGNLSPPLQPRPSPPRSRAARPQPPGVCKGGQEHRLRPEATLLVCAPNPHFCGPQPDPGRGRRTLPAVDHPRHPIGSVALPREREGARALYRALPPPEEKRGKEGRADYGERMNPAPCHTAHNEREFSSSSTYFEP